MMCTVNNIICDPAGDILWKRHFKCERQAKLSGLGFILMSLSCQQMILSCLFFVAVTFTVLFHFEVQLFAPLLFTIHSLGQEKIIEHSDDIYILEVDLKKASRTGQNWAELGSGCQGCCSICKHKVNLFIHVHFSFILFPVALPERKK